MRSLYSVAAFGQRGCTTCSLSVTGYGTAVEHIIVGTNGHNYQKLTHTHRHTQSSSITYAKESKSWQPSRLYLKAGQKDFAFSAPSCTSLLKHVAVFTADARMKLLRLPLKCSRAEVSIFSKQLVVGKALAEWTTKSNSGLRELRVCVCVSTHACRSLCVCVCEQKAGNQLGIGMPAHFLCNFSQLCVCAILVWII